jgi:hypothetical protein
LKLEQQTIIFIFTVFIGLILLSFSTSNAQETDKFAPQPLYDGEDNGINVLLDHAHQFTFFMAWDIPPLLREGGFRVISSQATINTVLSSDRSSLVRFGHGKQRPFGWLPNPKFNTVITYQLDTNSQTYLPEEMESLRKFVETGGGLIIIDGGLHSSSEIEKWSLNSLCREFGASFTDQQSKAPFTVVDDPIVSSLDASESGTYHSISIDDSWKVLIHGNDDTPILAIREFKKGRIAVISDIEIIKWGKDNIKSANGSFLHSLLGWVSANQSPVGGTRNLPSEAWGGGAIYPELEADIGNITILYAKNQKEPLLDAIRQYMPQVKEKIESWLPSKPLEDRMYLILSSGDGGGWAVNVYEPKEVGIISLDQEGILSIFAHELAHTMAGPPNDSGQIAGRLPELFSEAHAGWFQGKIEELRTGSRGGHEPNKLFDIDKDGKNIDIAKINGDDNWKGWIKLWWIFQKLDERYGTVWYPRWLWAKNMRWKDSPDRQLNWDDVVEDMSIAVGEDLFPFFHEIGTALEKDRLPEIEFLGNKLILSVAPITITKTGKARLEEIGDYKLGMVHFPR